MAKKEPVLVEGVQCYLDEKDTVWLKLEDVARGLGFVDKSKFATSGESYIRWNTVNRYLNEFDISQQVAKDDFIPEQIFYKLAMKASNEAAIAFQDKIAYEILPAVRKTGTYSAPGCEKEYQTKATSAGEVSGLIKTVNKVMEKQGSRPYKIAAQTEKTLNKFGIETISDFVEEPSKQLPEQLSFEATFTLSTSKD